MRKSDLTTTNIGKSIVLQYIVNLTGKNCGLNCAIAAIVQPQRMLLIP
ncbi:MAG: hypothetical protein RMY62_007195 [Nostoc sp. ZfuVER08]|nr:hypothetical protein [Nostoc sp. ZfuVER08]